MRCICHLLYLTDVKRWRLNGEQVIKLRWESESGEDKKKAALRFSTTERTYRIQVGSFHES